MGSKSRFTTLVLLETPGELSSDPCAIALYASRPLSPGATQHALPSRRYPLLGPVFHRLDRTSLPTGAGIGPAGLQASFTPDTGTLAGVALSFGPRAPIPVFGSTSITDTAVFSLRQDVTNLIRSLQK